MSKVRTPIRRVDSNHAEIVRKLRKHKDLSVWDTHTLGRGFPDILIGYDGNNVLIEIKKDYSDRLTHDEQIFRGNWKGYTDVARTYEEICFLLKIKPIK